MIKVASIDNPSPPKTTTPIPRYNSDPAPGNITNGTSPNNEVKVDMKMGRIRFFVASIIAAFAAIPSSRRCNMVCSIIKIALFTTTPVKITKPSIVSISRGCLIKIFKMASPAMPPAPATGIVNKMIKGSRKLRNKMTINRKITKIAVSTLLCIARQVWSSALAAPSSLIDTPCDIASLRISGKISLSIMSTTSSRASVSFGRNCNEMDCRPPRRRTCSGAVTTSILAS